MPKESLSVLMMKSGCLLVIVGAVVIPLAIIFIAIIIGAFS